MDKDKLIQFLAALDSAFLEERTDEIRDCFVFPVVIYSVAGVTLVRDAEMLERLTQQYRDALTALGVVSTSFEITHHDPPKNRRMRATVSYSNLGPDETALTGSVVRYFLLETDGAFKIEMMEYLQEPLSPSVVEQIVH